MLTTWTETSLHLLLLNSSKCTCIKLYICSWPIPLPARRGSNQPRYDLPMSPKETRTGNTHHATMSAANFFQCWLGVKGIDWLLRLFLRAEIEWEKDWSEWQNNEGQCCSAATDSERFCCNNNNTSDSNLAGDEDDDEDVDDDRICDKQPMPDFFSNYRALWKYLPYWRC